MLRQKEHVPGKLILPISKKAEDDTVETASGLLPPENIENSVDIGYVRQDRLFFMVKIELTSELPHLTIVNYSVYINTRRQVPTPTPD